jgi:purine-binding chemotaxis protein CheW
VPEDQQICTFHLAEYFFGIDVLEVHEVIRSQILTRIPLAPPVVRGLMNLRGQIVTALDLRRRLDLPERPADLDPVNIVIRTPDGPVSLLVDRVGDVLPVPEADFEKPPEALRGVARELILGVYKLDGRLLLLLDAPRTVKLNSGTQ